MVKIPQFFPLQSGQKVLTMEWIDGIRCTDPQGIRDAGIDVDNFIKVGPAECCPPRYRHAF